MRRLGSLFDPVHRGVFFTASGGLGSVVIGLVTLGVSEPGGFALIALGIILWALAGSAERLVGLAVTVLGVSLDAKLMSKEHGEEFKEAAKQAPDSVLAAVIPLLREDVASDILEIPSKFDGKPLVDPDLGWLRQELYVTVFAIQRPADGDRWVGGGRISEMSLPAGTRIAVLGERDDIELARTRLATT